LCVKRRRLFTILSPSLSLSLSISHSHIAYRVIGKAGRKKGFAEGEGSFKKGKKLWEIFVLNYNKLENKTQTC